MAWIIVGLGNPGTEYENTRHNTGRMCVQAFADKYEISEWRLDKKLRALTAKVSVGAKKAQLVLPENFMNNSGSSVKPVVGSLKAAGQLVVVYDDLDLPLGVVKVAFDRGSGGHRGLESVVKALKTKAFVRVRVGICPTTPTGKLKKPKGEEAVVDYILGKFAARDKETLNKITKVTVEALVLIVTIGREHATQVINSM